MGLISSLILAIVHLLFVVSDVLLILILIRAAYNLWHFDWLRPLNNAIQPAISLVADHLGACATRMTGKRYSEKTLLISLVIGMTFLRFLIAGLFAS